MFSIDIVLSKFVSLGIIHFDSSIFYIFRRLQIPKFLCNTIHDAILYKFWWTERHNFVKMIPLLKSFLH